jgi:hypothetical protein
MLLIEQTIGAASANANNRNGFASNPSKAKNRRLVKFGLGPNRTSTFHNIGLATTSADVGPAVRTLQCRLNKFLTSCPEIISVKDNLVSGRGVAELPLAATAVLANGFW